MLVSRYSADGFDDAGMSSAATDIPAHPFPDFGSAAGMAFTEERNSGKNLPWRAITALEGIGIDEGLLHGMQPVVFRQTFDGGYCLAFGHGRQPQARLDASPVGQHCAGAAGALITAFLGAGKAQLFSQSVKQGDPRIKPEGVVFAIDGQGQRLQSS